MCNRTKFSFVVLLIFLTSLLTPSSIFAESPEPPLEVDRVEPVFQTISVEESIDAIVNGGIPRIGENWIANGNAESGTTPWTGGAADFIVSIPYGTTDMPTPQDPGPTARGTSFFKSGGTNAEKNAWQTWGISPDTFSLATGKVRFTLSGFFGGKGTSTDMALLRVYFGYWDPAPTTCHGISSVQVGPVTAADRGYQTGLLERTTQGLVPAGTNCLTFQMQMFTQDTTAGMAFADNLSFVINGLPVYLPLISSPIAQPTNTIPAAPTSLIVNQTNLTSLELSWKDNSNNETGFLIRRAIGASTSYADLIQLGPDTTSYVDKSLDPATTYKYRVSAYNGKGTSAYASVTGATSSQPASPPNAPANCWTSDTGSTSTQLGWVDSSNNEEYFILSWKLQGYDWYEFPQGIEPDATYVTIVDLPSNTTTLFRVKAHNAAGNSAVCETSAITGITSNMLKIANATSYPIVSLEVDGVEQFPVYPMGLVPNNYYELYLGTGAHSLLATTGFWQNKTDRFYMYSYFVDFNIPSGGSLIWTIPDIAIKDLLTQFSPDGQGYWEGYFFEGTSCRTAAFRFDEDGSYQFYVSNSLTGTGNYALVTRLPETFSVKFTAGGQEGWLLETYGQFYMNNGPTGWNQITYVYKPQGYVRNEFCP